MLHPLATSTHLLLDLDVQRLEKLLVSFSEFGALNLAPEAVAHNKRTDAPFLDRELAGCWKLYPVRFRWILIYFPLPPAASSGDCPPFNIALPAVSALVVLLPSSPGVITPSYLSVPTSNSRNII